MCFGNLLNVIKHGTIINSKEWFHGKHYKCCDRERRQKFGGVSIAKQQIL
jgi:hypothetical protein